MGRLVKNHLARLIILTAALYQVGAGVEGFFWPKIFFDFATHKLDVAVKPIPFLQIINVILGLLVLAFEWPLNFLSHSSLHRSIPLRLVMLLLFTIPALLLYQGTNSGLYYLIGMIFYFWALGEGEVIYPKPWTKPKSVY